MLIYSIIENITTHQNFFFTVSNNLIRLAILGGSVYYNIYVLIPKYLATKKFSSYLGFLLLLVFIISPIEVFFVYVKSQHIPEMQETLLENLNWSFVPNLFVLGTSTLVKITLDWYQNIREKQVVETQAMQSELRFLKSQINPHFLFNTLNSLYALTLKKSDKAPEIVLKLSEMMRYMLYECNERYVPLHKEVNYIANYLDLERLRQGNNVDITFETSGNIGEQKIAPLLFIHFIENSFKHGAGNHISKGFVRIRLSVEASLIHLLIENSKPDSPLKPVHPRSGGIGLVNVRRRLDLLYPGSYQMKIDDSPKLFSVSLKIMLE